jgi:HTH-type transcriptional regulator/antitoxin HigA
MLKQSNMKIKAIKTEKEYSTALKRVSILIQENPKTGSENFNEMEVLSILIKEYELQNHPVPSPNPIDAIKFRLDQLGLDESALTKIIGYRSRKSEIMNRKRKLTLEMVRKLNVSLNIPADVLIKEY